MCYKLDAMWILVPITEGSFSCVVPHLLHRLLHLLHVANELDEILSRRETGAKRGYASGKEATHQRTYGGRKRTTLKTALSRVNPHTNITLLVKRPQEVESTSLILQTCRTLSSSTV